MDNIQNVRSVAYFDVVFSIKWILISAGMEYVWWPGEKGNQLVTFPGNMSSFEANENSNSSHHHQAKTHTILDEIPLPSSLYDLEAYEWFRSQMTVVSMFVFVSMLGLNLGAFLLYRSTFAAAFDRRMALGLTGWWINMNKLMCMVCRVTVAFLVSVLIFQSFYKTLEFQKVIIIFPFLHRWVFSFLVYIVIIISIRNQFEALVRQYKIWLRGNQRR